MRLTLSRLSARHQRSLLVESVHVSPRVDIEGDLDAYVKQRKSRREIRRRWRKLRREHAAEFRFDGNPEDLEADLRRGFEVEAAGWKARTGTAIASSPATVQFYTAIARAYHARGELRLVWLLIDGAPRAFNLCVERAGRLHLLKTGFDESAAALSPGLIVNLCTIERCFELGLRSYELLGGSEQWKGYFQTSSTAHVRMRSYRRAPLALSRYVARRYGVPVAKRAAERLPRPARAPTA
jgi:CelD/BcsL family acetyltransferase involved in cellulose biosynthesis